MKRYGHRIRTNPSKDRESFVLLEALLVFSFLAVFPWLCFFGPYLDSSQYLLQHKRTSGAVPRSYLNYDEGGDREHRNNKGGANAFVSGRMLQPERVVQEQSSIRKSLSEVERSTLKW